MTAPRNEESKRSDDYPPYVGIDDQDEWDRCESIAHLKFDDPKKLGHRDNQDAYIHILHMMSQPCWLCGQLANVYEAAGTIRILGTADAETGEPHDKFKCVRCGVRMARIVPFLAGLRPWFWGRPKDITPTEVLEATKKWEPSWNLPKT